MTAKPPLPLKTKPLRIAILAYTGCMATEIFAVADVLLIATHVAHALRKTASPPYAVQVVGLGRRAVTVAGGFSVGVDDDPAMAQILVEGNFGDV